MVHIYPFGLSQIQRIFLTIYLKHFYLIVFFFISMYAIHLNVSAYEIDIPIITCYLLKRENSRLFETIIKHHVLRCHNNVCLLQQNNVCNLCFVYSLQRLQQLVPRHLRNALCRSCTKQSSLIYLIESVNVNVSLFLQAVVWLIILKIILHGKKKNKITQKRNRSLAGHPSRV